MTREEILEKSRKENNKKDEYEQYALMKAGKTAVAVGGILCAVLFTVEAVFFDNFRLDLWAVFLSIAGTNLLVKYFYRRKVHELIFGIIEILIAIAFIIVHFVRLSGNG